MQQLEKVLAMVLEITSQKYSQQRGECRSQEYNSQREECRDIEQHIGREREGWILGQGLGCTVSVAGSQM